MPLSATEIVYHDVLDSSTDSNLVTSQTDEEDLVLEMVCATSLSCSCDHLYETLPLDEAFIEAMNGFDRPWDDIHHRSYFLPELARIEQDDFRSTLSKIVGHAIVPLDTHDIYAEGNMVEKLLNIGFIYPIILTKWVSNLVLVNKKKGTIHVCMDFRYLNKACPKDNFLTPFINQILDECVGSKFFYFMDEFPGYNQI
jgi:hypothetical protein